MAAKIATKKVWRTNDNKLVEDGHPDAAQLVARRGELIQHEDLSKFSGVSNFFADPSSKEGENSTNPVKTEKKVMTRPEIAAYRDARDNSHAFTGKAKKQVEEKSTRSKPAKKHK